MRARDGAPASCRQGLLPDRSRQEACAAKSESAFGVRQPSCRFNDFRMIANRKSGSPAPALQNVGAPTFLCRFTNPSFRAKRRIPLRSIQERFLTPQTAFGMTTRCMTGDKNVGAPTFPNRNWVLWSAGACSRFYAVNIGTQMSGCEALLSPQRRRRAAALQNVGAPTFPLRDKPAAPWGIA